MGDHLLLYVDRLMTTQAVGVKQAGQHSSPPTISSTGDKGNVEKVFDEDEPLLQLVECRICQEEDHIKKLENPCACSGSLKYAHRNCVQRWCNEKGDITCEICHETYKPGYNAPPRSHEETAIDISEDWTTITGAHLDMRNPHFLAVAEAQRHFLEAEYDDYDTTNASGAAFCRSVALILMALLLLRHALTVTGEANGDASTVLSLLLLRAAGFLLPCYIMAWAMSILQQRRRRQEAAALAATEVAFILRSGQARNFQFASAPDSTAVL